MGVVWLRSSPAANEKGRWGGAGGVPQPLSVLAVGEVPPHGLQLLLQRLRLWLPCREASALRQDARAHPRPAAELAWGPQRQFRHPSEQSATLHARISRTSSLSPNARCAYRRHVGLAVLHPMGSG